MQALCHRYEALFVLDEVQTGCGVTGTPWCYQQLGLEPDVVAFAKKVQVGGIMAGRRVDDEPANVFRVPSRINSTWGGNLIDMVRSTRLLELIESTGAIANAARVGVHLRDRLTDLSNEMPSLVSNARARGLLAAIDLRTGAMRDDVVSSLRSDEHVLALSCGERTLRVRPALSVTEPEIDHGCDAVGRVLRKLAS
jgi:L-lysine 6-transaminase